MPAAKCAVCGKTAYPLESVTAIERTYHKGCFKCATCKLQLNLTNFKGLEGQVYCSKHVPKARATAVTDTVAMKQAQQAPKRTAEGLGVVQKGTGEKPRVGTDTLAIKHAQSAPRRTAEGLGVVQKGTGGKPSVVVFGADGAAPAPAPAAYDAEEPQQAAYEEEPQQAAYEEEPQQQAYEEEPAAEPEAEPEPEAEAPAEEYYEEPAAEGEAPAEEYYEEEQPAEGEAPAEEEQAW